MLMHFARMLLFSFGKCLEFLWKDYIYDDDTDEGNLNAFRVFVEESF